VVWCGVVWCGVVLCGVVLCCEVLCCVVFGCVSYCTCMRAYMRAYQTSALRLAGVVGVGSGGMRH
jgi:hypothetical protein